ncbi:hypothetical protein BDF20DRAFT_396787 [Mycotypha africana]|uniref:uncharacterized protein n=1 Tax=Mycotypha africana TaxID=64632 RepID=UPI0023009B7E|nr:uncharacterized protein BDF20DRAFT_396787 [Mycotypha africana]KAI8984569.1 hypothetical protein BDF20DRAFT_396787 [Mycotypha africana]
MKFKWMKPYYDQEQVSLATTSTHNQATTRNKKDTYLELANDQQRSEESFTSMTISGNHSSSHRFIDYQTYQKGEKCCGCLVQMKRLWVKNCQDCQMKFHPHCINRAPPCTKGYHIPSTVINPMSTVTDDKKITSRYTPLGPLSTQTRKGYLSTSRQPSQQPSSPPRYHHHYKTDGYSRSKTDNNIQRHFISSIMT